jgi:hypothetical protein
MKENRVVNGINGEGVEMKVRLVGLGLIISLWYVVHPFPGFKLSIYWCTPEEHK